MKKKILVTGGTSYVGRSLKNWIENINNDNYEISMVDLKNDTWKKNSFINFDVIIHLAAVVHRGEKNCLKDLYYKINRDLTLEVAMKAKESGVPHFIFMSTMSVYGLEGKVGEDCIITHHTNERPITYYGKSKLSAESELIKLRDSNFKISILRPPIIYGPNCPGNYSQLIKIAKFLPVFPLVMNKRSMLHIDKLCQYLKDCIEQRDEGIFFPQDDDYVNTSLLYKKIREGYGKRVVLSRLLGLTVSFIAKITNIKILNKVFGNLVYDKELRKKIFKE